MNRTSDELDAVASECLNLLIVYYTYREMANNYDFSSGSRFDMHRWWVCLRTLENDIILRLCRLDDDDKNNHSLREAMRSVREDIPTILSKSLDKKLKEYRQLINPLKIKSRNYFLAHMSKSALVQHDPQGGLGKYIEAVINIFDSIAGIKQEYFLSVGSLEKKLNLREELSGCK
ncbi:hypothetical protein [Aeromonas sp. sif2416]|uniref:AbiU2 domain-containing protein n=1 Tax=Aeromonas sp. sif2416 TaxID=2854793 RepID=UPI001C482C0E|nr:hypothetical protein [Aeromonas sp. sif2416]MBV7439696.1 hypothetical protein [Aeromonas sp. sif2416]